MKRIYLLIITLVSLHSFAQKDYTQYYNAWRLGLNIGGAWQTADYRSCWGMAGGLTLEKGFAENNTNFFSFAIRGRYLAANTYGMDYNRNYDVKGNNAYNGNYDPKVNFVDSVSLGRQYVYDNYRTTLYEGSLELQLSFNRLRAQTHVILNLWGGVGITSYRAKSDLLDGNGKIYDFSKVDSSGSKSKTLSSYNALIDKKYESYAYGSRNGNLITFSPSAGIGLGYQFSPVFSLLLEYKVTFPQGTNADLLDGKISSNRDAIAGSNDYYHYTGINFLFTLRGKKKTTPPKDETVYTNTVVPIELVVPTASVIPENTVAVIPVTEPAPIITYITPPVNAQVVTNQQYKISAQVLNVTSHDQIRFVFNGSGYTNFSFSPQTHILEFNAGLNIGTNSVQIIASNSGGTDNKISSVIYELPRAAGTPPTVNITNPAQCPANSNSQLFNLTAVTTHVPSRNNIVVKLNSGIVTAYSFNPTTGRINLPLSLMSGSNSIEIIVNNNSGNVSKTCFINYLPPKQVELAPVVSYINPPQPGFVSNLPSYTIKAQVLNVNSKNNISVYYNGLSVPFVYDAVNKQVSFTVNLNLGSNPVTITAGNAGGTDTKATDVIYQKTRGTTSTGLPPVVNLIEPANALNATNNTNYNFRLGILYVASKNDISVMLNGSPVSLFSYNTTTKEIELNAGLITGMNTLIVKATNTYGTDSKTVQVNYQPVEAVKHPPVVTITKPAASPANVALANYLFKATVTNVPNNGGLTVKLNGTVVSGYLYDGFNVSVNALLIAGNNTIEVTAANADGTDVKSAVVNYRPRLVSGPPPVVSLINPAFQMNATDNQLYNFKLSVLNVSASSGIEVLFNGTPQSNYTYNAATKEVDFQTNLVTGNNVLSVKGTNQFGSDSKQINVNYTPHAVIKLPPLVTFIDPVSSASVQDPTYVFKAGVTNVPLSSGLVVRYNGNPVSNYSYDGANLSYTATLIQGNNALQVSATNADGSDVKTATVNYQPKQVVPKPPTVIIIKPSGSPVVSAASYNFMFRVYAAEQPDIHVRLNGTSIAAFNFVNGLCTFTTNLTEGSNTIVVTATNTAGADSKTATVIYKPRTATNPTEPLGETIAVPPATTTPATGTSTTTGNQQGESNKVYTICHHTSGAAPQTITIPYALWPSHSAHGDTMGACPASTADSVHVAPRTIRHNPTENKTGDQPRDTLKATPTNTPRRPR